MYSLDGGVVLPLVSEVVLLGVVYKTLVGGGSTSVGSTVDGGGRLHKCVPKQQYVLVITLG